MDSKKERLWPYSKALAIFAIPLIWVFFLIILVVINKNTYWPPKESAGIVVIVILVISLVPLLLLLLDFFAAKKAVIDTKWGKIDFSKIDLARSEIKQESFGLPENIGTSGPIISDTSPMSLIKALKEVVHHEIAVINIKDGNAWWVTRLLALSAGGLRAGTPNIFVFIGQKENQTNSFLGWSNPKDILNAILEDKEEYRTRYDRSVKIAKQVLMFSDNKVIPNNITLSNTVTRYTSNDDFTKLGDAVTEQIIMDQLAVTFGYNTGSLEEKPDRLTLGRLFELFGHCLITDKIDLLHSNEEQINQLLSSRENYIALVKNNQYDSMLRKEDGERLILHELFHHFLDNKSTEK